MKTVISVVALATCATLAGFTGIAQSATVSPVSAAKLAAKTVQAASVKINSSKPAVITKSKSVAEVPPQQRTLKTTASANTAASLGQTAQPAAVQKTGAPAVPQQTGAVTKNQTSAKASDAANKASGTSTDVDSSLTNVLSSFDKQIGTTWYREMANDTYSGQISSKYTYDGQDSYRIELRKTDPIVEGSKRSEIAAPSVQPLSEHTYTVHMLLPNGGNEDYALDPEAGEIIMQWHNVPDPGEPWTTPPLALRTLDGQYILERCWDAAPITSDAQMTAEGNRAKYNLGSYLQDKGKWVTWTFHIRWGWLPSQHPILEVYKNGVEVLNLDGQPNTTNDRVGPYWKLGIYKWGWAQPDSQDNSILSDRVIYYADAHMS